MNLGQVVKLETCQEPDKWLTVGADGRDQQMGPEGISG